MPRRRTSRRSRRRTTAGLQRIEFPYLKDRQGRYAPIVYLRVWAGNRWVYLQTYVDSGASWSIFHLDVAQLLGIKLGRVKRRYVLLGNGQRIPIYLAKIKVRFGGEEFQVPVGFSEGLSIGFNLMGRAGFFERYLVCFDDKRRCLTFTRRTRP